jgi:plasmid maintenance system antidote protein VapI
MQNKRIQWNRLPKNHALCLTIAMNINLDELYRTNLIRIMTERGLKQIDLAAKIETTPQYINAIIRGERGLGTDMMSRICRVLNIEPWEFTWTEKTPIIRDESEQQDLFRRRRARAAGVAEDTAKYETFRIEEAKKKGTPGSKGKAGGVPRGGPRKKRAS